jgi:hypothetical protein
VDAYQKDIYRAVVAVVGVGDMAALDVLLARDLIDHNPMPGQAPGMVGFKQWASAVRSSFPDVHGSVEIVLAEGDLDFPVSPAITAAWTADTSSARPRCGRRRRRDGHPRRGRRPPVAAATRRAGSQALHWSYVRAV